MPTNSNYFILNRIWQDEIVLRVKNRHYYLRLARQALSKGSDDVQKFCALAELEQTRIDEFLIYHENYDMTNVFRY